MRRFSTCLRGRRTGCSEQDALDEVRGVTVVAKSNREEFDWTSSRIVDAAEKGAILGEIIALDNKIAAERTHLEELTGEYSGWTAAQDRQLEDAVASGVESIDLVYQIPSGAGAAAQHLGAMLDDADEYCRAGQHLLTLATPPDLKRYRQWYLGEFVRQLAGEPPTPWSQY